MRPTALRLAMLRNGYIPLPAMGKAVLLSGWVNVPITEADLSTWESCHPNWTNTGLRTGAACAVDIDVLDPTLADQIETEALMQFGSTPLRRVGKAPKVTLLYRADDPTRGKMKTAEFRLIDGIKAHVEILGCGQQTIVFGTHPETGQPYRWNGPTPEDVPLADLPVVTEAELRAFLDAAERIFLNAGAIIGRKASKSSGKSSGKTPADLAGPSTEAIVAVLDAMPNPDSVDRGTYVAVALATVGAMYGHDEQAIGDAWVAWAERWALHDNTARDKWDSDFSQRKHARAGWDNLLRHAQQLGADVSAYLAPELNDIELDDIQIFSPEPATPPPDSKPSGIKARPFVWLDPRSIAPREWVYGHHYIRKFLSATVAPGGLGKSSHALVEALDMVTGRGLLNGKATDRRFRVWYWNGEDPLEETERRVAAICLRYGITAADIGGRLFLNSGRDTPIIMATENRDGLQLATPVTSELIREATVKAIDVLILDPFVKTHQASENDNNKIDAVATQFAQVADAASLAIELIHHVRKVIGAGQDRSADDARGASALVSAARSVRVLNPMLAEEAASLGISEERRRRYFRVDDGKANLVPPSDRATWRHLASVDLGNARPGLAGDSVGVAEPWVKPAIGDGITPDHVDAIRKRLTDGAPNRRDSRAQEWVGRVIAEAISIDVEDKAARKRITKIVDLLIERGALVSVFSRTEKGRPVQVVEPATSYDPQSFNCRIPTVDDRGKHSSSIPPTLVVEGYGE